MYMESLHPEPNDVDHVLLSLLYCCYAFVRIRQSLTMLWLIVDHVGSCLLDNNVTLFIGYLNMILSGTYVRAHACRLQGSSTKSPPSFVKISYIYG